MSSVRNVVIDPKIGVQRVVYFSIILCMELEHIGIDYISGLNCELNGPYIHIYDSLKESRASSALSTMSNLVILFFFSRASQE
jgi:hypothetical protein